MYKFQIFNKSIEYVGNKIKPINLELPKNSELIQINYFSEANYSIEILVRINNSENDQEKYNILLIENEEEISNSYIYLHSIRNKYNDVINICYRKEQN
jgi:hypothetical protein